MKRSIRVIYLLLGLVLLTVKGYSQKKYFYTALKVPLIDYISGAVNDNTDFETDGLQMDAGLALKVTGNCFVETGLEYFIINPYKKTSYVAGQRKNELRVNNSAIGIHIRPVFRPPLNADETTFFRLALGFNVQKPYSSARYTVFSPLNDQEPTEESKDNSAGGLMFTVQPTAGLELPLFESVSVAFEVCYSGVNWNKSMDRLSFAQHPELIIPRHKTNNIFISARFVF